MTGPACFVDTNVFVRYSAYAGSLADERPALHEIPKIFKGRGDIERATAPGHLGPKK
jgi:hypothetical protein